MRPGSVGAVVIALTVIGLALDNGASSTASRSVVGILVWWAVGLAVVLLGHPATPLPRQAVAGLVLLAGATAFTGLSTLWAPSAERAFAEFERMALYLGFFTLTLVTVRRAGAGRWVDGLAAGIAGVAVLALAQRLLPAHMPETDIPEMLPTAATRLSYPLGYWNGLGILLGVGMPLLVRTAVAASGRLAAALGAAAIPALGVAIYLTSSRGGVVVAVAGIALFVVLAGRPVHVGLVVALGAAGAVAGIALLRSSDHLVNGPLDAPGVAGEGRTALLGLLVICAATGVAWALLRARVPARVALRRPVRLGALGALAAIGVAIVAAARPAERIRVFTDPPGTRAIDTADYVQNHLFSGGGSGRWQFWGGAWEQFVAHPLVGQGAGSFESWWAQHGSITYFIRNAHSQWLETLGELGLIGFVLLAGTFVVALVTGGRRLRRAADDARMTIAALLAATVAFVLGAGIDWIWQLPLVAGVGLACLALLVGAGTEPSSKPPAAPPRRGFGTAAAFVLVVWALACAQLVPWLTQRELERSRAAAAAGDIPSALEHAASAQAIQPWAATPHLQTALAYELSGDYRRGRLAARRAVRRDEREWRTWVVLARLAAKDGRIPEGQAALRRARALNPRSPLLRPRDG